MNCRTFLLFPKFLFISQEPEEVQSSSLQGKFRACRQHQDTCSWEVPRVTPRPSAPPGGQAGRGRLPNTTPVSAAPRSQGAGSGEVPAAALAWYPGQFYSPCSLHAGTHLRLPTECRGVFWAVPGSHTWLHSDSAPAADLEPQCGPRVSNCCFWKAPGSPSRSIQSPKWFSAPTLPAASPALLSFLKHMGTFLPQGLCTCCSLC